MSEVAVETQERLDRAWGWVAAARAGFSARFDPAGVGLNIFYLGDCTYVLASLEEAGCQPQAVDVDAGGVTPSGCLERAEAELDAIEAGQRPMLLLPARAELHALVVRLPADDEAR